MNSLSNHLELSYVIEFVYGYVPLIMGIKIGEYIADGNIPTEDRAMMFSFLPVVGGVALTAISRTVSTAYANHRSRKVANDFGFSRRLEDLVDYSSIPGDAVRNGVIYGIVELVGHSLGTQFS
tara:strand:+ start:11097 stop:11465 length:369 start_codon:yes stop_codon:yes gene_type:complete